MTKDNINSKKGFTIIEVVLVLAIAGLIFLMVFIALPALQRSQRDTQRRNDYAALSTAVTTYMTNNNGSLPIGTTDGNCTANFTRTQINSDGTDPNGQEYDLRCTGTIATATDAVTGAVANGGSPIVYVIRNAQCQNGAPVAGTGNRSFAIYGQLEGGTYCQSS